MIKRGIINNKRGQTTMSLPFGLIFSIILIIVFIVAAFIAVKSFLDVGECSSVGFFYRDFEKQVNDVWRGSGADVPFKIDLPSGITKVCFANMSARITNLVDAGEIRNFNPESNVFLLPVAASCDMHQKIIENLDITRITSSRNPYCISSKSELRIKKEIYDRLVFIEVK